MTNDLKTGSFGASPSTPPQFGARMARPNVDALAATATAPTVHSGVVDKPDTIRRKDIHDKWSKISDAEAVAFTGKPDLVAMINARYGTSTEQAQLDVDAWAKNRVF
ncbi:MAG TPA: hypothetical protein VIG34_09315 [Xanthobacteraceae bacterium]|jgi:glutamate racemase